MSKYKGMDSFGAFVLLFSAAINRTRTACTAPSFTLVYRKPSISPPPPFQ